MKGKHWIIVVIIIVAGYQVFTGLKDLTKREAINWTNEDRANMIEKCISDTGDRGILFPELTREYCNCSHDLLFAQFIPVLLSLLQDDLRVSNEIQCLWHDLAGNNYI